MNVNERSQNDMAVIVKAKNLMDHSFNKTANTNNFPKKYRFSIGARIENYCIDIYENLVLASECNLADVKERQRRFDCQQKVIVLCKLLNTLIELSYNLKSIALDSKAVAYWVKLVVEVKKMTATWRNNDKKR